MKSKQGPAMRKIKSCGVLIVRGQPIEEFLLLKHPTRLDLPKGHVEPGETDLQCALRELVEETGITAKDIELDPKFRYTTNYTVRYSDHPEEEFDKTLLIYLGRLKHEVSLVLTEHNDFQWFTWSPPHQIQTETIDDLLAALAEHLEAK